MNGQNQSFRYRLHHFLISQLYFLGWIESGAYQLLEKSSFLNFRLAVAAKDHGYCSGAQHQRKDRYLEAPYDTIVFILQNVEGKKFYGGSFTNSTTRRQFEQDLRTAFSMAVPSEAMKQRRMKEGRGFGDLDGGGGVYKGKKKSRDRMLE